MIILLSFLNYIVLFFSLNQSSFPFIIVSNKKYCDSRFKEIKIKKVFEYLLILENQRL